jgi:uncharacterized protein
MIFPMTDILPFQMERLETIILKNPVLKTILDRVSDLALPNWYLGAGCLAQTVWNHWSGYDLLLNINDVDLVYFDATDLSFETEANKINSAQELFPDFPFPVDVKNQARVHLWYEEHFGYPITPYRSIEEAISCWPTTATAVAVRINDQGTFTLYAPYGLSDVLGMIVRPNKKQITEDIYWQKVNRWKRCWPELTIIPW